MLCGFIFLNTATPIALAKSLPLYYPKILARSSTGDFMGCLYWATAIMAFLCNISYTASAIRYQFVRNLPTITLCIVPFVNHKCDIPSNTSVYQDKVHTLVAKVTVIPLTVFTELLASIHVISSVREGYIRCSDSCYTGMHCILHIVHVLALWNISIALQLLTMITIPIFGLLFIQPQMTIFFILLLVIILSGLTFMAAYLLYLCQQSRRRQWCNPKHF